MTHKEAWKQCVAIIKKNLPEKNVKDWFDPIVPLSLQEQTLTLQLPSQLHYEWIEEHYVPVLRKAIHSSLGMRGKLKYAIFVNRPSQAKKGLPVPVEGTLSGTRRGFAVSEEGDYASTRSVPLRENYTFENFVEGSCNQLAYVSAHSLVEDTGNSPFNPLVLYGRVGLGKTHLAQAMVNKFAKQNPPPKRGMYVPSERFVAQFVSFLRNGKLNEFLDFYFSLDLLVVDDVQFLRSKKKTQEVFFHIFNHLHQRNKKIVFTSDVPPKDLDEMDARLLSRFKWGLSAALEPPDYGTKLAIIRHRMQKDGIAFSDEVVDYLARHVNTNIRELEGVIVSLVAQSVLMKNVITLDITKQVVEHIITAHRGMMGGEEIIAMVSEYFHVSKEAMKSSKRTREVANARQVAMYFIKRHVGCSLKHIGKQFFGGRDHSTVIHAIRSVKDAMQVNNKFKRDIENIVQKIEDFQ